MAESHLVIGAGGGIGGAVCAALEARGQVVLRVGRSAGRWPALDLQEPSSIAALADALAPAASALDGIYLCSGVLHAPGIRPERRMADLDAAAFERVMRINALGPLQLLTALLPRLDRQRPLRVAALSARVGSLSDNRLGGWTSYRCSKAALNMGLRNLAIELARSHPLARVTLFHPGTTDTALSKPFQHNVAPQALFSPQRAAAQFLDVLDQRPDTREALFLDWAGRPIAY